MIEGILGRKLGMTQVFDKSGGAHAVTVIEAGPCVVTQVKTPQRDGYAAVQLGYGTAKRVNQPMRGHLKKLGDFRYLREFRVDDPGEHKVGEKVGVELFQEGDYVDIAGTSKGRGFAGGVKRYGFRGGPKTHGQSDRHRAPGSIGAGSTPGRVWKGLRMAGHMGAERASVRHLQVMESDPGRGLLLVKGAVPGARNGLLYIRYSAKSIAQVRARRAAGGRAETPAEGAPPEEAPAEEAPPEEAPAEQAPAAEEQA
jgi:large subunit ribosomal protein L3